MDFMSELIKYAPTWPPPLPFIPLMNFHAVVDVCFCLLQQPWQFMTSLRYLSHPHLKADRLMISVLVAGFHFSDLKFITRRTRTPLCAFVMLFMTEISCKHRLFLTDWLSRGFFVVRRDSATATCQWSAALIRATKTYSAKMLHLETFLIFPVCVRHGATARVLKIELDFTEYYFYIVVLRHRVLMIIHETGLLPKDGSAITSVLRFKYF